MANYVIMPVLAHLAMTKRAVESAKRQDIEGGTTLFIVDNGSDDGTANYLRSVEGDTVYVRYTQTRSLNYVWNRALSYVFDSLHLDYALVTNNDLVLHEATYRLLVADGGPFVTAVGTDQHGQQPNPVLKRRPHPDFSCFLIRRTVWETVGRFDERYWAYCSDADYHLRMHRAGIEAVSLSIPFFHESSGTIKYADKSMRERICRQADADRALFREHYGFEVGSPEYNAEFKERP